MDVCALYSTAASVIFPLQISPISISPTSTLSLFPFRNVRVTILTGRLNHLISCFTWYLRPTVIIIIENLISSNLDECKPCRKRNPKSTERISNSMLIRLMRSMCVRAFVYQVYLDNGTFICHTKSPFRSLHANAVASHPMSGKQIRNFRFYSIVRSVRVCVRVIQRIDLGIQHAHA